MKYLTPVYVLVFALVAHVAAPAATVDLLTVKDGYEVRNSISGGYIGTNWTGEEVHVGYDRVPTAKARESALVYFDLSGLGAFLSVDDIQSVELRLNLTEAFTRYGATPFAFIMVDGYGDTKHAITAGATGWHGYDFTDAVKAALQSGAGTLLFQGYEAGGVIGGYSFTSLEKLDETTGISLGPYLHLSTVPVPPAVWLMMSGIVAMAGIGRRHTKQPS